MKDAELEINKFKKDILNPSYTDEYIVRQHLCYGSVFVFEEDKKYFELKNEISHKFNVHPNEIIMIGSGKLGFSLAPNKLWRKFNTESDIDMAIISEQAFSQFWNELLDFNINMMSRSEKEDEKYKEFLNYFFKGWIRPDLFPFKYSGKDDWFYFFRELTTKIFRFGEHRITAGIYKDFKSFEIYHMSNIKSIKAKLSNKAKMQGEKNVQP